MTPYSSRSPGRFKSKLSPFLLLALLVGFAVLVKKDTAFYSRAEVENLRYSTAANASNVNVAVVFAQGENELYYGMRLAFADPDVFIKAAKRHVHVDVVPFATENNVVALEREAAIARHLARDPSYVAVVGHSISSLASLASVSYEYNDLLFISTATGASLTAHGFDYVFRAIPTDEELTGALASLCHRLITGSGSGPAGAIPAPVSRMGIFYEQTTHSDEVIRDLEVDLTRNEIQVAFEKPFDSALNPNRSEKTLLEKQREARLGIEIDSVAQYQPEMIAVIGDSVPAATALWDALSRSPLRNVPLVLMAGSLDANAFIDRTRRVSLPGHGHSLPNILALDGQSAGPSLPDQELRPGAIYVVTDFSTATADLSDDYVKTHPAMAQIRTAAVDFSRLYGHRFEQKDIPVAYQEPEALAMRGYVAGMILKQAMEDSASVAPIDLQQALRNNDFDALGRQFDFTMSGDEKGFGTDRIPAIFKVFSPCAKEDNCTQ